MTKTATDASPGRLPEHSELQSTSANFPPMDGFDVSVVFSDEPGTLAALKAAAVLVGNLGGRIHLIAAQTVPYQLPADRPPVAASFTEQRLLELAGQADVEAVIQVYLCRDKLDLLRRLLPPGSIVVIGGRKHWWPTQEARLCKLLSSRGYRVIFVAVPSGRTIDFTSVDQALQR